MNKSTIGIIYIAVLHKCNGQFTGSKNDAKLKEQTDAFESILLKFMLDTSLKMDNPLYPKQAGSEIYESMYKDSLANQLSGSFGYSKLLFDWLKEQQK